MARVSISLGSNSDREHHVRAALQALAATFDGLAVSRVYESEPVGCEDGRNFYNLVVAFDSDWSVGELQAWCKRLERANGRRHDSPRFGPRTLDLDLLTVGARTGRHDGVVLPRAGMLCHAFVLRPLADLLPEVRHPLTGHTYRDHWAAFADPDQRLWPIRFDWREGQRAATR